MYFMHFLDLKTWPGTFIDRLEGLRTAEFVNNNEQSALMDLLQSCSLVGWHCTRLTGNESQDILRDGLQVPSLSLISNRIDSAFRDGLIDHYTSERLKKENERADSSHVKNEELWFFFFEPGIEAPSSYDRFLRYWGGECLYRPFEEDLLIANQLATLGSAAIVEADVPISALVDQSSLLDRLRNRFLVERGDWSEHDVEINHTGAIVTPLPASRIRRIVLFGDPEFDRLTDYANWDHEYIEPLR
jgi:hypothetical protein